MRSQLDVRLGVLEPQIVHLPPDVHSLAAAEEAIELAEAYGICRGHGLDESQQFTLRAGLGERPDGSWSASTVADFEPRQNGKNDTAAARELAGLVLFGEQLILHTAHEFKTANESFLRIVPLFENHDDLRKKVARIRWANGEQGIEFKNGARLKYIARTGGGGRGFAEADLTVYDEAQHLQAEHLAASGPARLANPNSQAWYMGSGGLETSQVAWRLRKRALAGDGGRFAYVEHTAEVVALIDGRVVSIRPEDVMDREHWARANPAYGRRITDESFLGLLEDLGPELWERECLCLWDPEPGESGDPAFPAGAWAGCRNVSSGPVGTLGFALDVTPNRDASCVAVVAESGVGGYHLEITSDVDSEPDHRPGTAWVGPRAEELYRRWGKPFGVVKNSPAWALVEEAGDEADESYRIKGTKVPVFPIEVSELAQACGLLYDAVVDGEAHHLDTPELNTAVAGAAKRDYGDAWLWSRRKSSVDISPLVAVTAALWVHTQGDDFDPAASVW